MMRFPIFEKGNTTIWVNQHLRNTKPKPRSPLSSYQGFSPVQKARGDTELTQVQGQVDTLGPREGWIPRCSKKTYVNVLKNMCILCKHIII